MSFGESIMRIREEKGISRKDFAEKLEIPYTTLRNYETDQREPGHKLLIKMATILSVSVDDLVGHHMQNEQTAPSYSDEAEAIAKDYDQLDSHGKKVVRVVMNEEKDRMAVEAENRRQAEADAQARASMEAALEMGSTVYNVPHYSLPMSAGTGEESGQEYPEDFALKKSPPRGTSYIAEVSGTSMEPTYFNGDMVFVHATTEIQVGQIGVFFMDGKQWIKELGDGELISHNPEYRPRPMTEDIRCQGLVLGVCDASYFE